MRLPTTIAALAACVSSASAFRDTSPFLIFSSSPFQSALPTAQLQTSVQALDTAKSILGQCSSSLYAIISQPRVASAELKMHPPPLGNTADESVKGRWASEVVGLSSARVDDLVTYLKDQCGAQDREDANIQVAVSTIYTGSHFDLARHNNLLSRVSQTEKYTVIYITTPSTSSHDDILYEAKFQDPLHMDLKRQLMARYPTNTTTNDTRPLFEKYQFFTPGIFMGILVSFVMLALLAVGLNAISSLQVSYGAFEKEMGPSANKKA